MNHSFKALCKHRLNLENIDKAGEDWPLPKDLAPEAE